MAAFDRSGFDLVCAQLKPQVAVVDIDIPWTMEAGEEVSRAGVRIIGVSNDEVKQLRALRRGFVEAVEDLSPPLLAARIRALVSLPNEVPPLTSPNGLGRLRIDALGRIAYLAHRPLRLAKQYFDLLKYLADRTGSIVPRDQLKRDFGWSENNTLYQAINELRKALGFEVANTIHNERGYGYGYRPNIRAALSRVRADRAEIS